MYTQDEDIESDDAEVADPLPDRVTWRADEDNDAAVARARRRLEMAHALAEMSLRMAGAVEARAVAAMEADEPKPDPLFGDVGLVFIRVMRAARLSLALEARLDGENQAEGYGRAAEPGEDPDDPIVFKQTRSQKIEVEEKLIKRLTDKRRGDIYDVIEHVVGVEARALGREGEIRGLFVKIDLGHVLEDMADGDDSFINHNLGAQVIEACERAGLPLGDVFAGMPPRGASAQAFKDRDHPS